MINRTFLQFAIYCFAVSCLSFTNFATAQHDHPPKLLSDWRIYSLTKDTISLTEDVHPYLLKTPLFTDYAWKWRAFKLEKGKKINITQDGKFIYPDSTILIKTFYYPLMENSSTLIRLSEQPNEWTKAINTKSYKLIETRILSYQDDKWTSYVYKWNADSSEAYLHPQGHTVSLDAIDLHERAIHFNYQIPARPQCSECHGGYNALNETEPLGPEYQQMDVDIQINGENVNQMARWIKSGIVESGSKIETSTPPQERAYLHVNCGHCHNAYGTASSSRLYLDRKETSSFHLGFCKPSVAAGKGTVGLAYDIKPGSAEKSILIQRLRSTEPSIKMPEIGRTLVDEFGVSMLENWINQTSTDLPASCGRRTKALN